ncbi:glutamate--cysteine ligase [Methylophaga sp. 41_12_T18]|nr:glutamate--cysteine ligase [Methylophaga sp. 41_12_T18]
MGQEIAKSRFTTDDFAQFHHKLSIETQLLKQCIEQQACSNSSFVAGLELEAWLIDQYMRPSPINERYLLALNDPLASAELAKFNVELNTEPLALTGSMFAQLYQQLEQLWSDGQVHAHTHNAKMLMIGILPTIKQSDLCLSNMSDLNRYRALNEQILRSRGKPIHLEVTGVEHLELEHHDVMLESAATSLQLHTKVPLDLAHHYYNASIIASAPMVALCANSPYLFGKNLWHESRIPLFEQAIETGGYAGVAHGPLRRVSFGTGYAKHSIFECFNENLEHFPVLLPAKLGPSSQKLDYLRLHNGTIWRWNRPLIGFDNDGTPHIRIEHRSPAAGPTVIDTIANTAFYYGLAKSICDELTQTTIETPFSQAKDNFYQAARFGLEAHIHWNAQPSQRIYHLIATQLIDRAIAGLQSYGIADSEITPLMSIIRDRVQNKQNGSVWQQRYIQQVKPDFTEMTQRYFFHQQSNIPVSQWNIQ